MSRKSYVTEGELGGKKLHIEIDGYEYGFGVDGLPEDQHERLVEIVEKQMQKVHDKAFCKGREQVQNSIKYALGIQP